MDACSIHRTHSPAHLTLEYHHVTPQGWQRFWVPVGKTPSGELKLWDTRTVALCPTGHRNVHFLLVELMKAAESLRSESLPQIIKAAGIRSSPTRAVAVLAMERWLEDGGQLLALTAAGEYGYS